VHSFASGMGRAQRANREVVNRVTAEEQQEAAGHLASAANDFLGVEDVKLYGNWICLKPEDMSYLLHLAELGAGVEAKRGRM